MASAEDQNTDSVMFSKREKRKSDSLDQMLMLQESRKNLCQINKILRKSEQERTSDEMLILASHPDMVEKAVKRATMRCKLKRRIMEIEDSPEVLKEKCDQLAEAIKKSKGICIYTGAGISTAASIPDYRGPNGVWTLLQKGQQLKPQELTNAEPTKTHMGLVTLYKQGKVKHVVSQNCDGLHIRSGLSKRALSEVHGNMYIEICYKCKPFKEYMRLFDVTEKTRVRRHHTSRHCHHCKGPLSDTIVHFGEKGRLCPPYRWKEAAAAAKNCDVILCLGTSLKVLKKYACLWSMNKKPSNRPKLFIVNLQWTPKDDLATLKINGKCDDIMERMMDKLGWEISEYIREKDPMFRLAIPLRPHEYNTMASKQLQVPDLMKETFYIKLNKTNSRKMRCREPIESPAAKYPNRRKTRSQYSCQGPSSPRSSCDDKTRSNGLKSTALDSENGVVLRSTSKVNVCNNTLLGKNNCMCKLYSFQNPCDKDHSYCWRQPQSGCCSLSAAQKSSELPWCSVLNVLMDHDYLTNEEFQTLIQAAGFAVDRHSDICNCQNATCQKKKVTCCKCGLDSCTTLASSCDCKSLTHISRRKNKEMRTNVLSKPSTGLYCVGCLRSKVELSKLVGLQGAISSLDEKSSILTCSDKLDCKKEPTQLNEDKEDLTSQSSSKQNRLISQSSIPGWFGKGLNSRKKRRQF